MQTVDLMVEAQPMTKGGSQQRIIYIDDDPTARSYFKLLVGLKCPAHVVVDVHADLVSGWRAIQNQAPAMIVCDIHIPMMLYGVSHLMDGMAFAAMLLERMSARQLAPAHVLLLSGDYTPQRSQAAIEIGCALFFPKPFDEEHAAQLCRLLTSDPVIPREVPTRRPMSTTVEAMLTLADHAITQKPISSEGRAGPHSPAWTEEDVRLFLRNATSLLDVDHWRGYLIAHGGGRLLLTLREVLQREPLLDFTPNQQQMVRELLGGDRTLSSGMTPDALRKAVNRLAERLLPIVQLHWDRLVQHEGED